MNYNEEIEKLSPKMKEFYNYAMNVESLSEEEEKKLFKKMEEDYLLKKLIVFIWR